MSETFSHLPPLPPDLHLQRQRASAGLSGTAWGRPNIDGSSNSAKQLRQVTDEFEALFINQFLQAARKSELAKGLFSSSAGDQFQSMMDAEISRAASTSMSLGISDALFRQFSGNLPDKES